MLVHRHRVLWWTISKLTHYAGVPSWSVGYNDSIHWSTYQDVQPTQCSSKSAHTPPLTHTKLHTHSSFHYKPHTHVECDNNVVLCSNSPTLSLTWVTLQYPLTLECCSICAANCIGTRNASVVMSLSSKYSKLAACLTLGLNHLLQPPHPLN